MSVLGRRYDAWPSRFVAAHEGYIQSLGYKANFNTTLLELRKGQRSLQFHDRWAALDFLDDKDGRRTRWEGIPAQKVSTPATAASPSPTPKHALDPVWEYGEE